MPFLGVEDALLEARKASSLTQFLTYLFLVGYKAGSRECYALVERMIGLLLCKDILSS